MKIIISQQDKKTSVNFIHKDIVDKSVIDKAEDFLGVVDRVVEIRQHIRPRRICKCRRQSNFHYPVDKLVRKNKIKLETLKNVRLEFQDTGLLTERVIRAIILGLRF